MNHADTLNEMAQELAHCVGDQDTFAGNVAEYAKSANFAMFNQGIDRAIEHADSLSAKLRGIKRFVAEHPELDKGGF